MRGGDAPPRSDYVLLKGFGKGRVASPLKTEPAGGGRCP